MFIPMSVCMGGDNFHGHGCAIFYGNFYMNADSWTFFFLSLDFWLYLWTKFSLKSESES